MGNCEVALIKFLACSALGMTVLRVYPNLRGAEGAIANHLSQGGAIFLSGKVLLVMLQNLN